jgi:hypothetical protein
MNTKDLAERGQHPHQRFMVERIAFRPLPVGGEFAGCRNPPMSESDF